MYSKIHFKGNDGSFRVSNRDVNALPLVILVIEFLDPAIKFNRQSIDAIKFSTNLRMESSEIEYLIKIQIKILRGAAGIT